MNKKNGIVALLLAMIFFLVLLTNNYKQSQEQLVEESNHLYSPNNSVLQKISFDEIIADKTLNSVPYRLFYMVENDLNLDIRTYYSNDYKDWQPPLKDGEFFKKNDEKKAIVGKDVKIKHENGKEYFMLDGTDYEVIAHLGKKVPNQFKHSVLLSDSSFFDSAEKTYTIDGKSLKKIEKINLVGQEHKNSLGANRYLSVDFFSPLIILFAKVIIVGLVIFLVYLYQLYSYQEILVLKIIGLSSKKILWENLVTLNSLFLVVLFIMCSLESMLGVNKENSGYWLEMIVYLFLMNLFYIIVYFGDRYEVTGE